MRYSLFILLLLSGCVSIPKAESKLDSQPTESARYCSIRFSQRDSISVRDSVRFDTLIVAGDTVFLTPTYDLSQWQDKVIGYDTVYKFKVCPAIKLITKTVIHDTTIFRD